MRDTAEPAAGAGAVADRRPAGESAARARRVLRDSFVYLAGNLLQKAAAMVLIPVYTTYLTSSQYALLELGNTVISLLLVAAALGVPHAVNKCYHRDCADAAARKRLVGTAVLFTLAAAGLFALLGLVLEEPLAELVFGGPEGREVYRYTLVWFVLAQLAVIPLELLRTSGRSYAYLGISFVQLTAQFAVTLYLVKVSARGLNGVLVGNMAGLAAVLVLGAVVCAGRVMWTFDRRLLSSMTAYGLVMIPVSLSGWVMNLSDRFFLQALAGLATLGVYSLGYKFGLLIDILLVMPFQRAWTPVFFGMTDEQAAARALTRVSTYLVAAGVFMSLGISLAVPPFLRVTATPEYMPAATIVPFVCLAYLFGGLANCIGSGLIVVGKAHLNALCGASGAATNLALNALLIPWMGMYGAAAATLLAFGAQLAGMVVALRGRYPLRLEWGRIGGLILAGTLPLAASYVLPHPPGAADLLLRSALLGSFLPLVWALRLVRPAEVAELRDLMRRRRVDAGGPGGDTVPS